jgi:hypothetical protein
MLVRRLAESEVIGADRSATKRRQHKPGATLGPDKPDLLDSGRFWQWS